MKKILLIIIIILLSVIAYASVANGYNIGNIEILGLSAIKDRNNELDSKIEEADKIRNVTYVSKISDLNLASKELIKEKKTYEELTTYSSKEDIEKANQSQKYEVEVLWAKVGLYATRNGVKLKFDIVESSSNTPNSNDLKFIATGSYISLTDFISDLEKDAKLSFTIENFALVPTTSNDTTSAGVNLQATFRVKDISLNLNTTTMGQTTSSQTKASTTNSADTQNKTTSNK